MEHLARTETELVEQLEKAARLDGRGKAFRKTFKVTGKDVGLVSWKFNEWDYGKNKIQLPSHARGLFTLEGEHRIVVRGYDKFFNINEVPTTKWTWLEKNTEGPYYVTSKENGCIILISALEDGTIIVCSKHSYGSRDDVHRNHAKAGEEALVKQLQKVGVTLKDFALKLYQMNVTAIAEYCDDSFEEHVVEYTQDQAGLYLHGLNLNKPIFETLPVEDVDEFSSQYGFKLIDYFKENDIAKLKSTLESCAQSGSFNGKETEGFVIRCKSQTAKGKNDYFFKFKFEEPYLMYRQWREVTKEYIAKRVRGEVRFNKHKYITNKYLDFVIPLLEKDAELCQRFQNGHGIIEVRKLFLENFGMTASEILTSDKIKEFEAVQALNDLQIDESTKFVLIPIATIGCGKTTVALTLTGTLEDSWAMVNNDDVPKGKNGGTEFVKRGLICLQKKRVVIMDRNNHQFRERQQLFETFGRMKDQYLSYDAHIQFVALNFISDRSEMGVVRNVTTDRVTKRGDNHQSIKAESDPVLVPKIMSGFMSRFQPCNPSKEPDCLFDMVIDLKVTSNDSSLTNSKLILESLHEKYPILISEMPKDSALKNSFNKALSYKPKFTKFASKQGVKTNSVSNSEPKTKFPLYFSLSIQNNAEFLGHVESLVSNDNLCLFKKLKNDQRVQDEFHVTCAHVIQGKSGSDEQKRIWNDYSKLYEAKKGENKFLQVVADFHLTKLIYDDKAVAVLVDHVQLYDKVTHEKLELSLSNKFPHITIGTSSPEIKPYYSNELAQKAADGDESVHIVTWPEEVLIQHVPLQFNFA